MSKQRADRCGKDDPREIILKIFQLPSIQTPKVLCFMAQIGEEAREWKAHRVKNGNSFCCFELKSGGGRWIRTIEVSDSRFTVCPLWPLGNPTDWSG